MSTKIKERESLDKYIEYFDPKYHKHYRLTFLVTMKRLVIAHLLKQGYKELDLLKVFRCSISGLKNLSRSKKDLADIDNYLQQNWFWAVGAKLKPVRVVNSQSKDGNRMVGFQMCLLQSEK